jgi:riboflavin transporter FmnP
MQRRRLNTRAIIMMAMFGAIAAVLMLLEVSVPFVLPFVKLDFSDLPILISGFIFGPALGAVTACLKILLKLLLKPTSTMYVGELSNLILAIAFEAVASIYYRRHRTKQGAVVSLILATVATSVIAVISNMFVIFPFYLTMFKLTMPGLVKMTHEVAPWVTSSLSMFLTSIFPFNLIKYGLVSVITFLIYKPLSRFIKRYIQ